MKLALTVLLATFIGCTAEESIRDEIHTIPPVTIDTTQDGGGYLFYGSSPCDTAKILHMYCRGEAHGEAYGIRYGMGFETRVDTVIQQDTLLIVRTVPEIRTNIVRDTIRIFDKDTVQVTVVEEYSFWDKLELSAAVIGGFVVLLLIAGLALYFAGKLKLF